ncbi:OmpA family protein [Flammeovirga sp. EKP202]|uniref:OmpA family protein n=1 Tax=Flammeovirga sp. EKP202 TaxID=2770592 RepID=UPI00165F57E5|nr:OmpA family protein [Flammeovirga sp. EKP202]MBD0400720.1 OmpA family protein [Flammeovirga sp. EKP202]
MTLNQRNFISFPLTIVFVWVFSLCSNAQTIFWADTVFHYSTQYSDVAFGATQALGKPNVPNNILKNPLAWLSDEDESAEITVGFSLPIPNVNQIIIAESFYHNAIQEVTIIDANNIESIVYDQVPSYVKDGGSISSLFIKKNSAGIKAIRIRLQAKSSIRQCGIDAVGVSTSSKSIAILPEVSQLIAPTVMTYQLNNTLNTDYDEFTPTLDIKGQKLLFTRNINGKPLLFEASLDSQNVWNAQPVQIDSSTNVLQQYITAISPDGITALSVIDGSGSEFHLSTLELSDSTWIEQEQIIIPNFQLLKQKSDFFLSNSRKVMLMSLTDHRSENESNIYVSFKDKDGRWSAPQNLGNTINTLGKETSPFLSSDEKTLYFASTGHGGFGGSDLFAVRRIDDTWTNWSSPENLGSLINTKSDETDLCVPITGDIGFFSRRNTKGNFDIYSVKLPILLPPEPVAVISGKVVNKDNQSPLNAKIVYTDLETQQEVGTVYSNGTTGTYYITLPLGKSYSFLAQSKGFLSQSEHIDLGEQKKQVHAIQNLLLVPLEETATLVLKNIFYKTNSSYLEKTSHDELDRIVELLKSESTIEEVTITGYTDDQGKESYNQWLSEKRAQTVKNYLVKKGIAATRLIVEGKGESEPVDSNETEEGRKQNRRVEFKITTLGEVY